MSIKSFYDWYNNLSALEQYLLKDRKMDMLIEEAIRSGELSYEIGPIEFVPLSIENDKAKYELRSDIKIVRRTLDE